MSAAFLTAVLGYAGRGWPVLPLHNPMGGGTCSCQKTDCNAVGKHPRTKNGLDDATTDAATIRGWWAQWPDANVGILTGPESGLVVIDLDNKGAMRGEHNFNSLVLESGGIPPTLTATTGNGKHLFFAHPGQPIKNSASKIAQGVDVRAARGFVVAAPSVHSSGNRYAWINPDASLAQVPDWLIGRLVPRTQPDPPPKLPAVPAQGVATDYASIQQGARNDKLYRIGCSLRGQLAMSDVEIIERLLMVNQCKCVPPLDEEEVLRIAASVCQHPPETGSAKSQKRTERNPLYWFKFNVRDFYADQRVQMMTDSQLGWYIRLRASAWQNGGFLPADNENLWRLAGAKSKRTFQRDSELVLANYERVNIAGRQRLIDRGMATEYVETLEKWMQERAAGEANRERLRAEAALRRVSAEAA
jgi:hypothetical protein